LGLVIVGALGYSAPRLGLAAAFAVFLAAQFLMGALVDHFGWMGAEVRPLNLARLAGMGLLLGGTWLITRN
jgi:transporter family-2 protein